MQQDDFGLLPVLGHEAGVGFVQGEEEHDDDEGVGDEAGQYLVHEHPHEGAGEHDGDRSEGELVLDQRFSIELLIQQVVCVPERSTKHTSKHHQCGILRQVVEEAHQHHQRYRATAETS